jgi:hypothetical protein
MPRPTRRSALLAIGCFAIKAAWAQPVGPGPITPAGRRLAALLDGMNVETLWQRGSHIDWRTGIAQGPPETSPGSHTHCSAFAAAVADRLGIYLLRPPEHGQLFLADAQERWLNGAAATGWSRIGRLADPGASLRAVALANQGELVLAVYLQPPRQTVAGPKQEPGHIAIVRPSEKSPALIESEGPDVIQAGMRNHRVVALRDGFRSHPAAWATGAIEYFSHEADPP